MVLVERMQALGDHARSGRMRGEERPPERPQERRVSGDARRAVIHEWETWAALNPDDLADPGANAFFFSYLQQKKPELLDFLSDDKRQTVSTWLRRQDCGES